MSEVSSKQKGGERASDSYDDCQEIQSCYSQRVWSLWVFLQWWISGLLSVFHLELFTFMSCTIYCVKTKVFQVGRASLWKCCSLMGPINLFVNVCRLCLTILAWRSHSGLRASIKSEPERWNTGKKNWESTCQNSQLLQGNCFTGPEHLLDQADPDLLWRSLHFLHLC